MPRVHVARRPSPAHPAPLKGTVTGWRGGAGQIPPQMSFGARFPSPIEPVVVSPRQGAASTARTKSAGLTPPPPGTTFLNPGLHRASAGPPPPNLGIDVSQSGHTAGGPKPSPAVSQSVMSRGRWAQAKPGRQATRSVGVSQARRTRMTNNR